MIASAQSVTSILAIVWLLLNTTPLQAQGTAFTYQGRLAENGIPSNGTYDLRFTIYDALTNGNALAGPVTNATTAVSSGLLTVTLDFGAGVFPGAARWMEIGARPGGSGGAYTTLTPRQPITATPYAMTTVTVTEHTAVWTGSEMIVWGGYNGSSYWNDTFSYTPGRLLYLYQRP